MTIDRNYLCFADVSANNVRPIRTYVSANIHFLLKISVIYLCNSSNVENLSSTLNFTAITALFTTCVTSRVTCHFQPITCHCRQRIPGYRLPAEDTRRCKTKQWRRWFCVVQTNNVAEVGMTSVRQVVVKRRAVELLPRLKVVIYIVEGEGVKLYVCSECPVSFFTASNMKRHQLKHSHHKQFCCGSCGKYFKHKHNVVRHFSICSVKLGYVNVFVRRGWVSEQTRYTFCGMLCLLREHWWLMSKLLYTLLRSCTAQGQTWRNRLPAVAVIDADWLSVIHSRGTVWPYTGSSTYFSLCFTSNNCWEQMQSTFLYIYSIFTRIYKENKLKLYCRAKWLSTTTIT